MNIRENTRLVMGRFPRLGSVEQGRVWWSAEWGAEIDPNYQKRTVIYRLKYTCFVMEIKKWVLEACCAMMNMFMFSFLCQSNQLELELLILKVHYKSESCQQCMQICPIHVSIQHFFWNVYHILSAENISFSWKYPHPPRRAERSSFVDTKV